MIEHTVEELLGQRIYGLCLGYEDLNDHDQLRTDPMLAVAVNKADPLGERAKQLFFCNLTESDLRSDSPVV